MKTLLTILLTFFALLAFNSCGDDEMSSSSFSSSCCLNGQFYDCPTSAAMDTCNFIDSGSECTRTPSKDNSCESLIF